LSARAAQSGAVLLSGLMHVVLVAWAEALVEPVWNPGDLPTGSEDAVLDLAAKLD
jgi:hypothetical protein